jgi:hypothetical protein
LTRQQTLTLTTATIQKEGKTGLAATRVQFFLAPNRMLKFKGSNSFIATLNFSNSFKQKEEKRFLHQWMS